MTSFLTLGLMSGTSMDGLDIALTTFTKNEEDWSFELHHCKTYSYTAEWVKKLSVSKNMSGRELMFLDAELGKHFAECVNNFLNEFSINKRSIDFIASHGHTVFHQPNRGITVQIGCGETIAYQTGIPVINDFRTKNVLAGGQGAPLVPIGDKLLFPNYDACINIGGFSNITLNKPGKEIVAFDISPGNLPLNSLSNEVGLDYDADGNLARKGSVNEDLLLQLNRLDYYKLSAPKSLGTEWLDTEFMPLINNKLSTEDRLSTVIEHITDQISQIIKSSDIERTLITGGGAKNSYLIERLKSKVTSEIIVPEENIIDFKEALIFGFLGCLYSLGLPNSLASVTGSSKDVLGGVIHKP